MALYFDAGADLGAAAAKARHFIGLFSTLAALNAASIRKKAGDYADVDGGAGQDVKRYIWDESDAKWVLQGSATQQDLALKLDKSAVKSTTGTSESDVMSQKAVTDIVGGIDAVLDALNGEQP